MYCSSCGKELNDKAVVCPQCGCIANKTAYDAAFNAVRNENNNDVNGGTAAPAPVNNMIQKEDKPNPAFSLLAFLVPIFGIVIYFADRHKTPNACKRYLLWSIISIGLIVVFYILYIFAFAALMIMTENV